MLVGRSLCHRIVKRYVENKYEALDYDSFTDCIKESASHSCDPIGCGFCDIFLLCFMCGCVFVFGRLKIRNLVRVYSANLFGYRNITLGLLCIVACMTAHSYTR